jgi:16S rRNA (uracil1498-N3)-methyltransferase
MRLSRLFTDQSLAPESTIELEAGTGHYVQRVLRLRAGDALVLFNGDGFDYAAELVGGTRDRVRVRVDARLPAAAESPLRLTLVQAVGKGDRMDYSLQKATELGVAAVRPLFTERTEVRLDGERLERRMAHWRGVLVAACGQSGRGRVPDLLPALGLGDWLETPAAGPRLVLAPAAERPLAAVTLTDPVAELLVGPEGGFSDRELAGLGVGGCEAVSLGPRVLRTETAGPAAIAVLQSLWGDFAAK